MGQILTRFYALEIEGETAAWIEHGLGSVNTILLYGIRVEPNWRRKGIGAAMLTAFLSATDDLDMEIRLWIEPDDDCPMTPDQLRNWYSRHGFLNAGYHEMIRPRRSTWN